MKPILFVFLVILAGCTQPPLAAEESGDQQSQSDCEWCGAADAPRALSSTMRIAPEGETGERLILRGRVTHSDGKPAPGILLYAYHTNAGGIYPKRGNESGNARRHGYLRGWLRTDREGRYEIITIRPGSYPASDAAAHVHATLSGAGLEEAYIDDFVFADDPNVNDNYRRQERKNGGSGIVTLRRTEEGWVGERVIVLR